MTGDHLQPVSPSEAAGITAAPLWLMCTETPVALLVAVPALVAVFVVFAQLAAAARETAAAVRDRGARP